MGLTLRKQFIGYKANVARKLLEAGIILENEIHRIVAIDKGKLDESVTTQNVEDHGSFLSVDVGSYGVFYAPYVEFGIGRIFNYHRPPPPGKARPVVWTGNGQHYMERSIENKRGEIMAKLREAKVGGSIIF